MLSGTACVDYSQIIRKMMKLKRGINSVVFGNQINFKDTNKTYTIIMESGGM